MHTTRKTHTQVCRLYISFKLGSYKDRIIFGNLGYPLKTWLMTPILNSLTNAEHAYKRKTNRQVASPATETNHNGRVWVPTADMAHSSILNSLIDAKHAYNKKGSHIDSLQTVQKISSWTKEKNLTGRFWVSTPDMANE